MEMQKLKTKLHRGVKLGFNMVTRRLLTTTTTTTHYKSCGTTQTYLLRPLHLEVGLLGLVAGAVEMLYYA